MDITNISTGILKKNREVYARQMPGDWAEGKVAAIDAELLRRYTRTSVLGGTTGYVLTATGQFEHREGNRAGFTVCGVEISTERQYGKREWWHCLRCGS